MQRNTPVPDVLRPLTHGSHGPCSVSVHALVPSGVQAVPRLMRARGQRGAARIRVLGSKPVSRWERLGAPEGPGHPCPAPQKESCAPKGTGLRDRGVCGGKGLLAKQ